MEYINSKDLAWLKSNTMQYFVWKNLQWSMVVSILILFFLLVAKKALGISDNLLFLSLLPSGGVLVTSLFISNNKRWQMRFLKYAKDKVQKEKSLKEQIVKIQEERGRALRIHVLLIDFEK